MYTHKRRSRPFAKKRREPFASGHNWPVKVKISWQLHQIPMIRVCHCWNMLLLSTSAKCTYTQLYSALHGEYIVQAVYNIGIYKCITRGARQRRRQLIAKKRLDNKRPSPVLKIYACTESITWCTYVWRMYTHYREQKKKRSRVYVYGTHRYIGIRTHRRGRRHWAATTNSMTRVSILYFLAHNLPQVEIRYRI